MVVCGQHSLNGRSLQDGRVGHPKSNLVVPLVLYTVACNGWGIDIVLQVPQDSTNPAKKG